MNTATLSQIQEQKDRAAIAAASALLDNVSAVIDEWAKALDVTPRVLGKTSSFEVYANLANVGPNNDYNGLRSTATALQRRFEQEVLPIVLLKAVKVEDAYTQTVVKIIERSTKPDGIYRALVKVNADRQQWVIARYNTDELNWQLAYSWDTLEMARAAFNQWYK